MFRRWSPESDTLQKESPFLDFFRYSIRPCVLLRYCLRERERELYAVPPPPQSSNSAAGATDGTALLRSYQTWKGSNIFFLQGRFIVGPDVRSLLLTIFLIVAPVPVFSVFVARKLMDDYSHHLGILIMAAVIVFTLYNLQIILQFMRFHMAALQLENADLLCQQ